MECERAQVSTTADIADGPSPTKTMRRPRLPVAVQEHLGSQLRDLFAVVTTEEQPRSLIDLVTQLTQLLDAGDKASATRFGDDLIAALPALRGFALSLAVNAARADDLVQEALLKAWANRNRFQPGTNFTAWLFTILRNHFYSEIRKHKREVEDADGVAASKMVSLPDQIERIELQNVWSRLAALPASQREALILVGAQGLTYEAAAEMIGCQVGTVKSRVSRARLSLADALGFTDGRLSRLTA